jgi:hypothetical protein
MNEWTRNVADEDPSLCRCGGGGWILTPYDSWEPCGIHKGPHPEDVMYEQEMEELHKPKVVKAEITFACEADYEMFCGLMGEAAEEGDFDKPFEIKRVGE